MKKPPEAFFKHMLESVERIETYVGDYKKREFMADPKTQDAVIRQFEIMGEAAGQVSANAVTDAPVPWRAIVGMRNRLIHDYMGVDLEIVWKTVKDELPRLKRYLKIKIN